MVALEVKPSDWLIDDERLLNDNTMYTRSPALAVTGLVVIVVDLMPVVPHEMFKLVTAESDAWFTPEELTRHMLQLSHSRLVFAVRTVKLIVHVPPPHAVNPGSISNITPGRSADKAGQEVADNAAVPAVPPTDATRAMGVATGALGAHA
jgi:hypothetical protein